MCSRLKNKDQQDALVPLLLVFKEFLISSSYFFVDFSFNGKDVVTSKL